MELPNKIKTLYKHWEKHTRRPESQKSSSINQEVLEKVKYLINERLSIYEKKETGLLHPYTSDPILSTYRFCNIYRELDRQTIYFHTLLKPLENDFPLWLLNMLFCRCICKTETVERIGLLNFNEQHNQKVYEKLMNLPSPKYGTAYIFPISLIQKSQWNTREKFFCYYFPVVINQVALGIEQFEKISVVDALVKLIPVFRFNMKFLLTELLIDVAYQYPQYIDLFKRFPIGPGSVPTMLMLNSQQDPEVTNPSLIGITNLNINYLEYEGKPIYLSAENWEGIGCEFRKYNNLSKGNGRRRIYKAH